MTLSGKVALVAGGTRGAGRGIATELGAAGATVYVTGRSTRAGRSDLDRPETIEETAELIPDGRGVPVRVDHSDPAQVKALVERIEAEAGRLDLLINDIWGGDALTEWGRPFWEQDLDKGFALFRRAIDTHIITSRAAVPLMIAGKGGLVIEITDGDEDSVALLPDGYRGSFFYDLAKATVIRLARAQAAELRPYDIAAVALTPGFLRSEDVLEQFGVTEGNWRDGAKKDPNFIASETPAFVGRAAAALAADPKIMSRTGGSYSSWELAKEYGFVDADGTRPDWGTHFREKVLPTLTSWEEFLRGDRSSA
jgi:NAD(P)-dependent dehydrogenase (short-subunit alcohol dehydrogenase family)